MHWTAVHWDTGTSSSGPYHADIQPVHIRFLSHHHHYRQVLLKKDAVWLQQSYHTTHLTIVMFDCSLVTDKLRTQDVHGAGIALSSALFMATMFGLMIQAILLVFDMSDAAGHVCSRLKYALADFVTTLQCYSHQMVMFTGAAPALIGPSVTYLKIRAWSAPAVLISMVAQVGVSALYLQNIQDYAVMLPIRFSLLSCYLQGCYCSCLQKVYTI